ncbi:MAG: PD-(D/E)XK nuclease-like domain-containing protein [Clostridia bacterium]|nr:PD-(D/E)XK nuclease-like domain-containing protein [Clostridia bacterium]
MSCSQYQSFCECEAKAMAKLRGEWIDEPGDAFIVGNYFHTYMESPEAHEQFCRENFDRIYKTKTDKKTGAVTVTGKYAPFEQADKMLKTAFADDLIKSLIDMPGENEKILTGKIKGIPWRVRYDKYVPDGRLIIDWKTVANIQELKWSDELHEKVTFIDAYGYMMRAAVYSEIEKQNARSSIDPTFLIVAISKQDYPDKEVLMLNHRQRYDYELEKIGKRVINFQRIKEGQIIAKRCGKCDYCRSTKKLFAIKPYYSLMPEFRGEREDEYADSSGTGTPMAET